MDNKSDKTDRYFRERLGGFEQNPPDSSWDAIASNLGRKKKKRALLFISRIAAGMAILLSTGIGIYLTTKPAAETKSSALSSNQVKGFNSTIEIPKNIDTPIESNINPASVPAGQMNSATGKSVLKEQVVTEHTHIEIVPSESVTVSVMPAVSQESSQLLSSDIPADMLTPVANPLKYRVTINLQDPEFRNLFKNSGLNSVEEHPELAMISEPNQPETSKAKKNRWILGGEVAPLYSYRKINADNKQSEIVKSFNKSENGILAYAGGVRVAYSTGRRFSVQSGIYYSRYGQEKNQVETYNDLYAASVLSDYHNPEVSGNGKIIIVSNSTGNITGTITDKSGNNLPVSSNNLIRTSENSKYGIISNSYASPVQSGPVDATLTQIFDYLELPLILRYKMIDRKMDFSISGGMVTNFLVSNSVNMLQDGKKVRVAETTGITRINYQGSLGMVVEYPLVSHFALTIEPRFRYYFNALDSYSYTSDNSSRISIHPFSFGFFAGLNYRF